jgi:peroxiredoxin
MSESACGYNHAMQLDTKLKIGSPAPDFSLPDLDGRMHALKDYLGQIVVINFWSAECPWSARADQELAPILRETGDPVVLLSVASNANEGAEQIRSEAAKRGIPLLLVDSNNKVADHYGAITTPHLFVLDSRGTLRYQGALDDVTFRQRTPSQNYLHQALDALLKGEDPDPSRTPPYGCTIVRSHA